MARRLPAMLVWTIWAVLVGFACPQPFSCVLRLAREGNAGAASAAAAAAAFAELRAGVAGGAGAGGAGDGAGEGGGAVDLGCAPADFGGLWASPPPTALAAAEVAYVSAAHVCSAVGHATAAAPAAAAAFVLEAGGGGCSLLHMARLAAAAGATSVILLLDSAQQQEQQQQEQQHSGTALLLAHAAQPQPVGVLPLTLPPSASAPGAANHSAHGVLRDDLGPAVAVGLLAGGLAHRLRVLLRRLAATPSAPTLFLALGASAHMPPPRQCARRVRALASAGVGGVGAATHAFWRCAAHWPRATSRRRCNRTDACDGSAAAATAVTAAAAEVEDLDGGDRASGGSASLGAPAQALLGGARLPTAAQELELALELGAALHGVGALHEAEVAFRRALRVASASAGAALANLARALLGRVLLSRGVLHGAEVELRAAASGCDGGAGVRSCDLDVGALLARRALPAVAMALARPAEAVAAHRQDEDARAAARGVVAAARRRSAAVAEGLRQAAGLDSAAAAAALLTPAPGGDAAPADAKTALMLGDTALEAFVAQFSGPLPTRPQEWQLAPVVPADGCGALVLDPAWVAALGAARLPSLPTGLLLLLRRGGCSFTEKASRALALALAQSQAGGSGVGGVPVRGMVVSNNEGQPATIMAGAAADVRAAAEDEGSSSGSGSCALERGVNFAGDDLGAVPVSSADECCSMCDSIGPSCARFTFFEATCYLKSVWEGPAAESSSSCEGCISGVPARVSGAPSTGGDLAAPLLPAVMVSDEDGMLLRQRLEASALLSVRLAQPSADADAGGAGEPGGAAGALATSFRQVLQLLPLPLRAAPCVFHTSQTTDGGAHGGCTRHALCSLLPPSSALVLAMPGSADLDFLVTASPGTHLPRGVLRALCRNGAEADAWASSHAVRLTEPKERLGTADTDSPQLLPSTEASRVLASQWDCSPVGATMEPAEVSALADDRGVLVRFGAAEQGLTYRVRCAAPGAAVARQQPVVASSQPHVVVDWPSLAACAAPAPFKCPDSEHVGGSETGLGLGFGDHLRLAVATESTSNDDEVFATAVVADASDPAAKQASGSLWLAQDAVTELANFGADEWALPRVKTCLELLRVNASSESDGGGGDGLGWARFDDSISQQCCPSSVMAPLLPAGQRPSPSSDGDKFLDALFTAHTQLGVFLDELGAPQASKAHFVAALHQCGAEATGLAPRIALTAPIVPESGAATLQHHERLLTTARSLPGILLKNGKTARPRAPIERSAESSMTLTPATMFHWYSGIKALPLNREVASMFLKLCPSLAGEPDNSGTANAPRASAQGQLRIGFVSSFLRVHSVGKLVHKMITSLNQTLFNATVFAASHFFSPDADAGTGGEPGRDKIASELRAAVNYAVLPSSLEGAASTIAAAALDILIFPEIGMDAFVYFLAFRRLAPVQAFFWGHPVSPAFPTQSIDYFVTSELFEPEGRTAATLSSGALTAQLAEEFLPLTVPVRVEDKYAEQAIRMQSLSTHFPPPVAPAVLAVWGESAAGSSQQTFGAAARHQLGLHADDRLYVCPQTLMKFHPAFDIAIGAILARDPGAHIVIVCSSQQVWWRERLQRRLVRAAIAAGATGPSGVGGRESLTSRMRFLPRLPHAQVSPRAPCLAALRPYSRACITVFDCSLSP